MAESVKSGALDAPSLLAAFRRHTANAAEDPHINPVARLASELFLALESGAASVAALIVLVGVGLAICGNRS